MKKSVKCMITAATLAVVFGAGFTNAWCTANAEKMPTSCVETATSSTATTKTALKTHGKSAFLMDFTTNSVIFAENETQHLPIASMCKIMTLILAFDAVSAGELHLDEEISISERAASMGGSQVFLEKNAKYPVRELLKSIVVCSANDSCVAIAERIAGSEEAFTERMCEKAKALGANDTIFANCTGLPKEPQYSCAKDVAIMLKELLKHEEYYKFGKVWLDKFNHPKGRYTEITNTNKLVRFYDGCDGGKTGFTNQAGFCLAATAKRNGLRVISVVIGADTSQNRFDDVRSMFDYAFANYTMTPIAEANVALEHCAPVVNGKEKSVAVCPERTAAAFQKRGEKLGITIDTRLQTISAPIEKGQKVGELIVYKDGVETDRVALVAMHTVEKATWFDELRDIARQWTKR